MRIEIDSLSIRNIEVLTSILQSGIKKNYEKAFLNNFYGISTVIKRFIGLELDESLYCLWPHGFDYVHNKVSDHDLAELPVSIVYSSRMTGSMSSEQKRKLSPISLVDAACP